MSVSMLDTLFSLGLILLLLFGILVVDDAFLTIQTTETTNFFASRAEVVQENSANVNQFFQDNVLNHAIFTHPNEFFTIEPITTESNHQYIETKILIHSRFEAFQNIFPKCKIHAETRNSGFCTHTTRIEMP